MLYHYMTLGNDLEVTHTSLVNNSTIVHFEEPDELLGFKIFECKLPKYEIVKNKGFNKHEVTQLMQFCKANAALILTAAKVGGIANA